MFSTLRTRFGIPGVISVIALVFALFGGAYAASSSSNNGKATASAKAKKGPRGPKGATGPAGPAGAQGPAGPAGAKGDAGANGAAGGVGPTGPQGTQGTHGVTGAQGPPGATGFSGFTETLPPGKTETGTWNIFLSTIEKNSFTPNELEAISFPIPLASSSEAGYFFSQAQVEEEKWGKTSLGEGCQVGAGGCTDTKCRGTATEPTAPAGVLCVYTVIEELINISGTTEPRAPGGFGYGKTGSYLSGLQLTPKIEEGKVVEPARIEAHGTWAVTAP